ncbi:MAG TPA: IS1182 family transposase [Acidimicrobiales bacterium]|nr:IS1182 family transposase [Acidimicrobiales bacterium]
MQGRPDPDRQLLDAAALCRELVEEGTVYSFLADHRHELFPDAEFADLFPSGRGRPSVPAELVCSVMVLQALEGLSDRDAVRQLRTRIDWKVACGLALDDKGFDFTVLTYWRTRLRRSARPQRIFEAIRSVVDATGVLKAKHRRALDSTILDDAVATQDTVTQLVSAVRRVRRLVPEAAAVELRAASDTGSKPVIDWADPQAREELVSGLVADAVAVLAACPQVEEGTEAADAVGLLSLVAGQDVEPGEAEGTWRIARKVAKDRVISTVDTEARHGHKSRAVRVDGFKAHICVEPSTGIVTAAAMSAANAPDGSMAATLLEGEPPLEVLADSAYGSGALRHALEEKGHHLVIKPLPTHPAVAGGFVRDDFRVDHAARSVTCPAGHSARYKRSGVASFAPHCASCPMRARCTRAANRSFSVGAHDVELVAARSSWREPDVTATYRQHRPMAERSISWLVAKGNRRLRYRGIERNQAWLTVRVGVLNLRRLLALGLTQTDRGWALNAM